MLSEKQISAIVKEISEKMKSVRKGGVHQADWGEMYKKCVDHAEEVEVHACGNFPAKLIGDNFPGETDEEKTYRRKSFQPITKPYWKKAMRTVSRVWAEQNYSIDWNDEAAKKYFLEEFPIGSDIRNFFKTIVTEWKIAEPNGVLALNLDIPTKEGEDGLQVVDQSKEVDPYATVYESEDVIMFKSGVLCLVLSDEKSVVRFNDRDEKTGLVFYLYDEVNIYRIYQTGKKVDWIFANEIYYAHNLGYVPAWKLKGMPEEVIQDEVYYESYFSPALPHLNEAVIIHSTNRSVRNKVSYPTRVYYDQPCTNTDCSQGKVWKGEGTDAKQVSCSTCNGTGSMKFSWARDYVHELPTATKDVGVSQVEFPGMAYVAPDGAIIKDNEEVIDKYLETAFTFLNIEVMGGNQKGLTDPTATKSKIDRDEQYISMLDISNELFGLLKNFLNAGYQVRYSKESPIVVKPPVTFDLVSSEELNAKLGAAKTSGLSNMAISQMTVELFKQDFPDSIARKAEIAQFSDVLFVVDNADISIMQTNGNIEQWQVILHINFERFVNEIMLEKKDAFMDMSLEDIDKILQEKAKAKAKELNAGKNTSEKLMKEIAEPVE